LRHQQPIGLVVFWSTASGGSFCIAKKLLDDQDLTAEDRRRLTRIVNEAAARLQDLGS
jgi:hypothetical protein